MSEQSHPIISYFAPKDPVGLLPWQQCMWWTWIIRFWANSTLYVLWRHRIPNPLVLLTHNSQVVFRSTGDLQAHRKIHEKRQSNTYYMFWSQLNHSRNTITDRPHLAHIHAHSRWETNSLPPCNRSRSFWIETFPAETIHTCGGLLGGWWREVIYTCSRSERCFPRSKIAQTHKWLPGPDVGVVCPLPWWPAWMRVGDRAFLVGLLMFGDHTLLRGGNGQPADKNIANALRWSLDDAVHTSTLVLM